MDSDDSCYQCRTSRSAPAKPSPSASSSTETKNASKADAIAQVKAYRRALAYLDQTIHRVSDRTEVWRKANEMAAGPLTNGQPPMSDVGIRVAGQLAKSMPGIDPVSFGLQKEANEFERLAKQLGACDSDFRD